MSDIGVIISQYINSDKAPVLLLMFSFLGGVLASVLPCNLAMLPLITGYVAGQKNSNTFKIFIQMIFFITGMSVVFSAIGIFCSVTGTVLGSWGGQYFVLIMASLILIIGLKLANILDFEFPVIIKKIPQNDGKSMFLYPIILGILFAIAGSPCSTPVLAAIMAFSVLSKKILLPVFMLFMFSLGQGLILVITGVFTSELKKFSGISKFSEWIIKAGGLLLILTSLILYLKVFNRFL